MPSMHDHEPCVYCDLPQVVGARDPLKHAPLGKPVLKRGVLVLSRGLRGPRRGSRGP